MTGIPHLYTDNKVTPGCEWVLAGEGTPRRYYFASDATELHETVRYTLTRSPSEAVTVALLTSDPATLVRACYVDWSWDGVIWHHDNGQRAKLDWITVRVRLLANRSQPEQAE